MHLAAVLRHRSLTNRCVLGCLSQHVYFAHNSMEQVWVSNSEGLPQPSETHHVSRGRCCRQGFDREIMTTDNLGAFYSGNITSANGTQLVLPIAPDTCGAGCVLISTQCRK